MANGNRQRVSFTGKSYQSVLGAITAYGSSYWKWGVDIDLKKGQAVPSPVSGKVTYAKSNGGFGLHVKIVDDDGNENWFGHLDKIGVKVGDRIEIGDVIGLGGNTGNVIKGKGGDGSHLDYTVKGKNGKLYTAREALAYANSWVRRQNQKQKENINRYLA